MSSPGGSGNGGSSGSWDRSGNPNHSGPWSPGGRFDQGNQSHQGDQFGQGAQGNQSRPGGQGGQFNPGGSWVHSGATPYGQQQYYDPITGQPLPTSAPSGYAAPQEQPQGGRGTSYQGFGAFTSTPQQHSGIAEGFPLPPPPREKRGLLIGAVATAVVLVIALVTTIIVTSLNSDSEQPVAQEPSPQASPSGEPTAAPPTGTVQHDPVVPGWQVVSAPRRTALYDVPPDWTLEGPESVIGFGPAEDAVTMTGAAIHEKNFCASEGGSFRALTGATARPGPDDATVAAETAQKLADVAFTVDGRKPHVAMDLPQPLLLDGGNMDASRVVATVTPAAPGPCSSPTVLLSIIATGNDGDGSVVHITIADQGVPNAVAPDVVDRIGESLRPR